MALSETLTKASASHCSALRPSESFAPLCEKLIASIDEFAKRTLPRGWRAVPFGSYVQDTCLAGAILDVALVNAGENEDTLWISQDTHSGDIVEDLAGHLIQTQAFIRLPSEGVSINAPVRLLAGNFAEGRFEVKQELALYRGGASTGSVDVLIRELLNTKPSAKAFVLLVKHWARSRGLIIGKSQIGYFPWTLLAIFCLQQQRVLPPFRELYVKGMSLERSTESNMQFLLHSFIDLVLSQGALPAPRRWTSLWTGSFLPAESNFLPGCGGRPDVILELQRLKKALLLEERGPQLSFPTLGWAPNSSTSVDPAFLTPPQRPSQPSKGLEPVKESEEEVDDADSQPKPLVHGSPDLFTPPPGLPPFKSFTEVPPFPVQEKTKGIASSRPKGAAKVPGPGIEAAVDSSRAIATPPRKGRWNIDEHWQAIFKHGDQSVRIVQLSAEDARGLCPQQWERRFSRREHQIRIAKATEEYKRWQEHFIRHGRNNSRPKTPRAVVQNSKREFETEYAQWRIMLHQKPPAA